MQLFPMAMKMNKTAWDILSKDEQTSLTLSLSFNKSTWESGEIMKRAHFKYLEINKRAIKFLEIFTKHFDKYGDIIPPQLLYELSSAFKEYIHLTLVMRKNISQTINSIDDPKYGIASIRNRLIREAMERLKEIGNEPALDLYSIIMDFDRWNNFRILPPEIQEPSAYKRRNKARYRKHLKNLLALPNFSVLKIIERFSYSGKYESYYLAVLSNYFDDGYQVIRVKASSLSDISDIGLFVFVDYDLAEGYAKLVCKYFGNDKNTCKLGQKFWPEFRVLIEKAVNYKQLENIHKTRSYMDKALFDYDKKLTNTKKANKLPKRVNDNALFYKK